MQRTHILVLIFAVITLMVASAAQATRISRDSSNTQLSVFAATDTRSDESGFGISMSRPGARDTKDLTFVNFNSYRMFQVTTLVPKEIAGYSTLYGLTMGYSERKSGDTAIDGVTTGLMVVLAKSNVGRGMSIDIRACTMTKDVNPLKWFTDPDIFWAGAGLSFGF